MKTLYKISSTGAVQEWAVRDLWDPSAKCPAIIIEWGQKGGAKQLQREFVEVNQSGRSLKEQVFLRMESRINRQKDKGYCETIEEARNSIGLNASKLLKPMLAQTYDGTKSNKNGFWQYKYNGHRCLITRQGDELIAYSRNGKPINTVNHIFEGMDIPEGVTLDGELYIHGRPLQTISSIVRRVQPANKDLTYIVYDQIAKDNFDKRMSDLHGYVLNKNTIIADTQAGYTSEFSKNEYLKVIQYAGYEGLMFRDNNKPYEPGKRSSQLMKVKMRHDMEVMVTRISPSKDGWAILHCVTPDKKFVSVTAPGTMEQKYEIYENAHLYIGKMLNIEFAEFTEDGVPFHPVAIAFREDE
jgi:ATP-dependent DNA ligase